MKNKLLIFFLLLMLIEKTNCQSHEFKFGLGYQRTWMLDNQVSPLKYQTSEKTFLLSYKHFGNESMFNTQFSGSIGSLFPTGFRDRNLYNTKYNADGSYSLDSIKMIGKLFSALFDIGYASRINSGVSKMSNTDIYHSSYGGASVSNSIFYSDNMTREGWINSTSVNAIYENIHSNGRHNLSLKLTLPLFERVTRLPYHNTVSDPNKNSVKTFFKKSELAWFGNFQELRLSAEYNYSLTAHSSIGLKYDANWLHYNKEKPLNILRNNISIIGTLK